MLFIDPVSRQSWLKGCSGLVKNSHTFPTRIELQGFACGVNVDLPVFCTIDDFSPIPQTNDFEAYSNLHFEEVNIVSFDTIILIIVIKRFNRRKIRIWRKANNLMCFKLFEYTALPQTCQPGN